MTGISLTTHHRVTDVMLNETVEKAQSGNIEAACMLDTYRQGLSYEFHKNCRSLAKTLKFMKIANCGPSDILGEIEYYSRWV